MNMSSTLERRIARLEVAENPTPGMIIHWELSEDAEALSCNGKFYPRLEGETTTDMIQRVKDSLTPRHGEILWLDEA